MSIDVDRLRQEVIMYATDTPMLASHPNVQMFDSVIQALDELKKLQNANASTTMNDFAEWFAKMHPEAIRSVTVKFEAK